MSAVTTAARRAPAEACSLTLVFLAAGIAVSSGLIGAAGGEALQTLDRLIHPPAPAAADGPGARIGLRRLAPAVAADPLEPAPPFVLPNFAKLARQRAADCLSEAVYYEAGHQPADGQAAIAQVVLNRVRDRNFPSTVCGVVYQGWKRRTGCQFSFACDGSRRRRPPTPSAWARARAVAERALDGYVMADVGTATHYHAAAVRPWWKPTVVRIAQIGDHVFYKWPGRAGRRAALDESRYSEAEPAVSSPPRRRGSRARG